MSKKGQAVVESLLILPVFLTLVFSIMELGNIAFQMILINHATWEVARIGSMTAVPRGGGAPAVNGFKIKSAMQAVIPTATILKSYMEGTLFDKQAGQQNFDLVVESDYPCPLIFPISSIILAKPFGSGKRHIGAVVRMPIEQPLKR